MKKKHKSWVCALTLVTAFIMASVPASAAVILAWDLNGLTNSGPSEWAATTLTSNVSLTSGLTRGSGITSGGNNSNLWASGSFDATSTSLVTAITAGEFVSFVVRANSGFKLSFDTIDANFRRAGNTSPNTSQWQYDVGSGFVNIGSSSTYVGFGSDGTAQPQISLAGISELQNVTGPVTFRLAIWGATGGGTWGIGRLSGDDLVFEGSVAAPQQSSLEVVLHSCCSCNAADANQVFVWSSKTPRTSEVSEPSFNFFQWLSNLI